MQDVFVERTGVVEEADGVRIDECNVKVAVKNIARTRTRFFTADVDRATIRRGVNYALVTAAADALRANG